MKRLTLTLLIFFFTFNLMYSNNWMYSLDDAKKMAITTNRLVLVDFWASWCGPCKRMDSESWSKEEVQLLMDNYVSVKIDIDKYPDIAEKYDVRGIPYVFILDGNGKVVYKNMSYKTKSQLMVLLKKYAINTSFLSKDLVNYYKQESFSSAFRLGYKYQDLALRLDKEIKSDFLNVSDDYFDESKKQLKESSLKNKDGFLQKIDLYEIQSLLILDKTKRALKELNKIEINDLDESNASLYNFLAYTIHKQLNDDEVAIWEEKMEESDKQKALLFLD
ncbi:thioredoxin family protein [Gaetbulibacter sp. NE]|uniref:thioredoxin family protein n=1 Tax=unclassified Gaetbulibacter TaxID=2625143 RepID=UPI0021D0DD74|nr:thioredoxin family protein [Gaetbulibacter sp. NE]